MNRRHLLTTLPALFASAPLLRADEAKLSVAVIGHTGRGAYGHGLDTMWLRIPNVQVVAVADADEKGRAAAVKKLGLKDGYADYQAMLKAVKPEIVAIGPRHVDQHRDMMLAAIEAGARGIYIEKPFCRSPQEADEVIAAAAKSGTKIAIAHRNRYHPVLPVVAQLIKDGAIGRVLEFRGRGKEDQRGGALDLWVLGSHVFNIATYFGGAPQACMAELQQEGQPVTKAHVREGEEGIGLLAGNGVHARFDLAGGLPLYFDSVQNAGEKNAGFGLQIIGNEGIIDFRIDSEPFAHICRGNPFNPRLKEPRQWLPITTGGIDQPEPIAELGKKISSHEVAGLDLISAIKLNQTPLCDAVAGRETIEMACAIFESHRFGGKRVIFPLETRVNPLTLMA